MQAVGDLLLGELSLTRKAEAKLYDLPLARRERRYRMPHESPFFLFLQRLSHRIRFASQNIREKKLSPIAVAM